MLVTADFILIGLFIFVKLFDMLGYYLPLILVWAGLAWLSQYVWDWLCIVIGLAIGLPYVYVVLNAKGDI